MNFFEFFNNFIFTDLYFRICTLLWITFALLSFIACVIQKIVWRIKCRKYNEEMLRFAKSIGGIPTLSMYFTMKLYEESYKRFGNDFLTNFPLMYGRCKEKSEEEMGYEAWENARKLNVALHGGVVFSDSQRPDDDNEDDFDKYDGNDLIKRWHLSDGELELRKLCRHNAHNADPYFIEF